MGTLERKRGERQREDSEISIFAAYLSPGTGSLKVFTLTVSFSNSVPAVGCSVLNQGSGHKFGVVQ